MHTIVVSLVIFLTIFSCNVLPQAGRCQIPPAFSGAGTRAEIAAFIEKWRQSWQGMQIDDYMSCYADQFEQGGKDLAQWRIYKESLFRKYKSITVILQDITIEIDDNNAKVHFHQKYMSDKYTDEGNKTLVLKFSEESGWQITKEISLN